MPFQHTLNLSFFSFELHERVYENREKANSPTTADTSTTTFVSTFLVFITFSFQKMLNLAARTVRTAIFSQDFTESNYKDCISTSGPPTGVTIQDNYKHTGLRPEVKGKIDNLWCAFWAFYGQMSRADLSVSGLIRLYKLVITASQADMLCVLNLITRVKLVIFQ